MRTTELTAIKAHTYDGEVRRVGAVYKAPDHHAVLLVKVGNAKTSNAVEPTPSEVYQTRDLVAAKKTPTKRGKYKRRDQRAVE